MKTIFDPSFRYSASFDTDLRRTYARIRRANEAELQNAATPSARPANNASAERPGIPTASLPRGRIILSPGWQQ